MIILVYLVPRVLIEYIDVCFWQGGADDARLETDASIEGTEERPAPPAAGNLLRTLTGPQFSVAVGIGIILAVLMNRIATPDLVDSQARTDILGVIASGGLVTNGVYLLVGTGAIPPVNVLTSTHTDWVDLGGWRDSNTIRGCRTDTECDGKWWKTTAYTACFFGRVESTEACRTRASVPSLLAGSWTLFEGSLFLIACTITAVVCTYCCY